MMDASEYQKYIRMELQYLLTAHGILVGVNISDRNKQALIAAILEFINGELGKAEELRHAFD